ncbi:MAG: porin family protein [Flavobacterium sp.]
MKKVILSVVIFMASQALIGQESTKSEGSFGIKGGLNYSTVTQGNFDEGLDPRTSFHIGFFGEIPLIDNVFSIQPEFIYSRQGFENNFSFLGTNYKTTYKIDYINMPILAKLYLGKTLALEAGPQFGLKINENIESDNSSTETNDVNAFDTALAGGISLNFDAVFISGRYTYSLNEVVKDSDAKNSVFQVGIGFKF